MIQQQNKTVLQHSAPRYTLITGGSGFVGVNLADRLLAEGKRVMVFDNLSRAGVNKNLQWLQSRYNDSMLTVMVADVRDKVAVTAAVEGACMVFHFAAQVAVTTSLTDPYLDFEVNALGTLNLLEAIRNSSYQPPIIFTSTNKVYGDLEEVGLAKNESRYYPENEQVKENGINEEKSLSFHSPYGCTKGVADQYILDYARTFGLKTVVFRMSCIYGPHQFGTEDQGWVAHFLIQALKENSITIYGDGKQVRDILFVDDLVDAFVLAQEKIKQLSGNAFNMGGGAKNTVSLLELLHLIEEISGRSANAEFHNWRPSDQKYYVSDFSKFRRMTGWAPKHGTKEGVAKLYHWLEENAAMSEKQKTRRKSIISETANHLEPVDK
jgi:CDP-paratose 2-epimerase